jgi:hypothetical protein
MPDCSEIAFSRCCDLKAFEAEKAWMFVDDSVDAAVKA